MNGTEHVGELGPRQGQVNFIFVSNDNFSDFFGELALILSRPRAATVKAKTFVKVTFVTIIGYNLQRKASPP